MKYRLAKHFVSNIFILVLAACTSDTPSLENPPVDAPALTQKAAIAVPDPYAADIGEKILRSGGNAVDAAIATGFALAVTYIDAGNIGGGGFMLIHQDGETAFLDYREKAPLAADRDMYLDENGELIKNASLIGGPAVAVPGTIAGFWKAHQRFGSLPWQDLLSPSIELAENGFLPAEVLVNDIRDALGRFGDKTNFHDYFGSIKVDEPFRQPELAETLKRISELGEHDFYRGETAQLIVKQMEQSNGLISGEDLASYTAEWRNPVKAKWRQFEVLSAPPPSSGGFAIIQLLKMKDFLGHHFEGLAHNSPQYIHLVAEMEKRVFADRAEYMGDPDFVDIDLDTLISDDYIARRAKEVDLENISTVSAVQPGLESPDTTHYSIIDQWGNAVSNTYTINWEYGSGIVVKGAGFLLNNEMDDFSAKPGAPNIYGVVGKTANQIQPGKRPLSSMSPTILLEKNQPRLVLGTPGGPTIFTSVFQTIVNIIDFNMSPQAAVAATRFHHQLLPPDLITLSITEEPPAETISLLGDRGYRVESHSFQFGDLQVVWRDTDNVLIPASDPRDRGVARVIEIDTDLTKPRALK